MARKMRPEKRAEIRRLIEEIRADLREVRALLERAQRRSGSGGVGE